MACKEGPEKPNGETYILASASPRRRELIAHLGLNVRFEESSVREECSVNDPAEMVSLLALQKAQDVASRHTQGEIVIGCDTCVFFPAEHLRAPYPRQAHPEGLILGKPRSHEEALDMISLLSGNTHIVHTGVALVRCEGAAEHAGTSLPRVFTEQTAVTVYTMTADEIASYAAMEEPMDKAGAYGIQGPFSRFIKRLEGDYFNVVGLPLGRLYQEIKSF